MDVVEKLADLLKDFRSPGDVASCTPAQLMAVGEHNVAEYERLNENPDTLFQVNGLIARVMARIQPAVKEKYGVISEDNIRQYFIDVMKKNEAKTKAWLELTDKAIRELDLNEKQTQGVNLILQLLPSLLIELFMHFIGKSYLIPEEHSPQIVNTLVEMAKEASDADSTGNN